MSNQALAWAWETTPRANHPYKGATFQVLLSIADSVNDQHQNELWMSMGTLARKSRVSRYGAQLAVRRLVDDGVLVVLEPPGKATPGRYRMVLSSPANSVDTLPTVLAPPANSVDTSPANGVGTIPIQDPKKNPKRVRAHFLPDTETLTPERRAFASTLGLTRQAIEFEWGKFADHEFAVGKTDWTKAWQNWCRAAVGRFKPNGPAPRTPSLAPSTRGSLEYRIRHGL